MRRLSGFALSLILLFASSTYSALAQEPQASADDTVAAMQDTVATGGAAIAGDIANGEALFSSNCAACHAIDRKITGPAMAGVNQRHDQQWLIDWIHDSPGMVASGDPAAVAIFEEYNQSPMPPFPQLTTQDIVDILAYVEAETQALQQPAAAAGGEGAATAQDQGVSSISVIGLIVLVVVLFLIITVLNRTIGSLRKVILKSQGVEVAPEVAPKKDYLASLKKLARNKKFIAVSILVVLMAGSALSWNVMWNVGVEQYYQPKQPIRFPHDIHAGAMEIDCQYCHGGAWKSKNASIPSLSTCMNCHNVANGEGSDSPTAAAEIAKIYKALDYDPATGEYGDNPQGVEWVRVHNLPDFAYFNHSQHVTVAEAAIREAKGLKADDPVCYACHGPVAEMEEIYQFSPLTMKWCVDCHRETEVIHAEHNEYYDRILAAHEQIKQGEKITVADLGGIDCARCHY